MGFSTSLNTTHIAHIHSRVHTMTKEFTSSLITVRQHLVVMMATLTLAAAVNPLDMHISSTNIKIQD